MGVQIFYPFFIYYFILFYFITIIWFNLDHWARLQGNIQSYDPATGLPTSTTPRPTSPTSTPCSDAPYGGPLPPAQSSLEPKHSLTFFAGRHSQQQRSRLWLWLRPKRYSILFFHLLPVHAWSERAGRLSGGR